MYFQDQHIYPYFVVLFWFLPRRLFCMQDIKKNQIQIQLHSYLFKWIKCMYIWNLHKVFSSTFLRDKIFHSFIYKNSKLLQFWLFFGVNKHCKQNLNVLKIWLFLLEQIFCPCTLFSLYQHFIGLLKNILIIWPLLNTVH